MAAWYSNLAVDRSELPALAPNSICQRLASICAEPSVVWATLRFVFGLAGLPSALAFAQSCIAIALLPVCFEITAVVEDLVGTELALRSERVVAAAQFAQKSETRLGFAIGGFLLAVWMIAVATVRAIVLASALGFAVRW